MQQSYAWTRLQGVPTLQNAERWMLGGLLLLTVLSRLYLSGAGTLLGDMRYWVTWSDQMNHGGPSAFYARNPSVDYLPVYPYVLWLLGKLYAPLHHLAATFGLSLTRDTLYKLPAIVADVATVQLLYLVGRRWATPTAAGVAATAYAVNPAIIADSSRWGQVDSIPAYLMLLAIVLFVEERMWPCGTVFALSVLTKPTALVLLPLLIVVALRRKLLSGLAAFASAALVTALLVIWPFVPSTMNAAQFIQQRFHVTTSTWPYATMNAFNFWALWQRNVLKRLDSQSWLGISEHAWGWLFMGSLIVALCLLVAHRIPETAEARARIILPAASVLVLGFFILLTRIHERHLLPALPALALTCMLLPRYWPFYIWLSFAYLLNLHFSAPGIFAMHEPLLGRLEVPLVSAINVASLVGMLVLTAMTMIRLRAEERTGGGLLGSSWL